MSHSPLPWHIYDRGIGFEVHCSGDAAWCDVEKGECGDSINAGFRDTLSKEDAAFIMRSVNSHAMLVGKLKKFANWMDTLAENAEKSLATCRFESLNEAYRHDAKNYRATAADIRKALKEAGEA